MEEDFNFMLKGYQEGVISKERLDDAVRRILGLKAKLNLHIKQADGSLLKSPEELAVIGCEEHLAWQKEASQKIPKEISQLAQKLTDAFVYTIWRGKKEVLWLQMMKYLKI